MRIHADLADHADRCLPEAGATRRALILLLL
jgi:hypothetical protein